MSLTSEWRGRIEAWRSELPRHLYRELGELAMGCFVTRDFLPAQEARARDFSPISPGTKWGKMWEYGWFKGSLVVPQEAAGEAVAVRLPLGGEGLVYVNGSAAGANSWSRPWTLLSNKGKPGEKFEVLVETYAGHGPTPCDTGPLPPERRSPVPPQGAVAGMDRCTYGIWEEDVYQLLIDVETLWLLRENLDQTSLRVSRIDRALRDFTVIVDFEQSLEKRLENMREARKRLKPLLECRNGSTVPVMYAIGHAHLDVAWLWPLAETERKMARTISSQFSLFRDYPEFKFIQSQPHLCVMLRDRYPDLYAELKRAVKSGNVVADGGMWVEADTNISGGESLIRQFLRGKRFFRDEFGVESELLWLPDVFGYSGALPQIMRGCGVKYFATQKILWNYHGGEPFPYNTFRWEGIDGSDVLAHIYDDYNSDLKPSTVIKRWKEWVKEDRSDSRILAFGWGDGGGGPTRDHLEFARRLEDLEGVPRVRLAPPADFFRAQEKEGGIEARYTGELYFQAHRGTYTSQARTKKGNRKCEFALREAEFWGTLASAQGKFEWPAERIASAWRGVLLNQFHDVLPGSSIGRVYEEAQEIHESSLAAADEVMRGAAEAMTERAEAVTVFNSLAHERRVLVPIPGEVAKAVDSKGAEAACQDLGREVVAEMTVPPCGYASLRLEKGRRAREAEAGEFSVSERVLENKFLRIEFNDKGEFSRFLEKESGWEIAGGPCNRLEMYKDIPVAFDAWDIDSSYAENPVELASKAAIRVLSKGPLVASLQIERTINESSLVQQVSLRRSSRRVDIRTVIDWKETHKLLKAAFPLNVRSDEAIYEIQFGHLRRPSHSSRRYDADRFEVAHHKWCALAEEGRGVAVLNDCKYGANAVGNVLKLTLLKSATAPDPGADRGPHEFTYAVYPWTGSLVESNVVKEAYDLNVAAPVIAGWAGFRSFLSTDSRNIVLEALKPAEDGSGDLILRFYESMRTGTRCRLTVGLPVSAAWECDMLENKGRKVDWKDDGADLDFRAFEVKTVRLKL